MEDLAEDLGKPNHRRQMTFRIRHDERENTRIGKLTALNFTDHPSKTKQEPAEDADINVLMKRMGVKDGSELPYFTSPKAMYGDVSEFSDDPVELADMLYEGQLAFMKLPAELRRRYNTPEELFNFLNNDDNYDEAVKLGLLAKKMPPTEPVSSSTSSVKEPLVPTSNSTGEPK